MKALSIRQPWAWLIVNGYKNIENRSWSTKFRGEFLVHASSGMTRNDYEWVKDYLAKEIKTDIVLPAFEELERGGIVGKATLLSCIPPASRTFAWHMHGSVGFLLGSAEPCPFRPLKGRLGFFDSDWMLP